MKFAALAAVLLTLSGCVVTEGVAVGVGVSDGYYPRHRHPGYARPYYGPGYWAPPPPRYGYGYGYPGPRYGHGYPGPRYRHW